MVRATAPHPELQQTLSSFTAFCPLESTCQISKKVLSTECSFSSIGMRGKVYLSSLQQELFWERRHSRILKYSVSVLALTFPITKPKLVDNRIATASRDFTNSTSSGWVSWWSLKWEFSHKSLTEGTLRRQGAGEQGREGEQLSKDGFSGSPVLASTHRNSGANTAQQSPSCLCILG